MIRGAFRFPGLRPLRYRDFALYWIGLTLFQVGEWIGTTTTAWVLYEITDSPVLLGIGGAIRAVSTVGFGLVGGAVADRVPRRRLLQISQGGMALSSVLLGVVLVSGAVTFWHIYAFMAVSGAFAGFDGPARRSLFPALVPRSELHNAVTIHGASIRLGRLVGPAIAGVSIASVGPAFSYFLAFLGYSAIIVAVALLRVAEVNARPSTTLVSDVREGIVYTLRDSLLRPILLLESVHAFFGANTALMTILARDVLHAGPEGLGLLLSAQAVGSLVSTAALVKIGEVKRKGSAMLIAGGAYVAGFAALALAQRMEVAAALVALIGVADTVWGTLRNSVFLLAADDAYRGRTMGILILAGRGGSQASQLQTGLVVAVGGPVLAMLLSAGLIAASIVAVNARSPKVRGFIGTGELPPAAAAATSGEVVS